MVELLSVEKLAGIIKRARRRPRVPVSAPPSRGIPLPGDAIGGCCVSTPEPFQLTWRLTAPRLRTLSFFHSPNSGGLKPINNMLTT